MIPARFPTATPATLSTLLLTSSTCIAMCAGCTEQRSRLLSHKASVAGVAGAPSNAGAGGDAVQGGTAGTASAAGAGGVWLDPRLNVAGAGPVTPAVRLAIDERPIGGASLNGGTTGGGNYADAIANGQIHYVDSLQGVRDHISSDTPAILLIAEGTYAFATTPKQITVCDQACNPATPVTKQAIINCDGVATYEVTDTHEFLRFGSNKTLIGLGKGATFTNAMISLSNVTNIILRNLTIQDVLGNVFGAGAGFGINLWPGDHIWVDHCTFRNIGSSYFNIKSTLDGETYQTLAESGYITITHNYFDGKTDGLCGQRARSVLSTNQVSALTSAYNWFYRSARYNTELFGPDSWAHVFNNLWSDVSQQGLASLCGATAISQGNAFESTTAALTSSNSGVGTYPFCTTESYGKLYAPMNVSTDENNLLDSASTLSLASQPTDGSNLTKPVRRSGHVFAVTAPTKSGTSTETYEVALIADPATVAAQVKAAAGAGKLF